MIATGVIVEYNPFHNGHLYHIQQARKKTAANIVIAVMSGHFLQRGEPALLNKWQRTRMALSNGADIVVELPYPFATGQAKDFAFGGISLLQALNCSSVCFGSEEGELSSFKTTYNALKAHEEEIQTTIRLSTKNGSSYPQALNNAYQIISKKYNLSLLDLSQPNNILGYHYYEQIQKHQFDIQACTIQRIAAGYHELINAETQTIASATGIRKALFETHNLASIEGFMPPASFEILKEHKNYANWENLYPLLRYTLLRTIPQQLTAYVDITEGIEFLFHKAAKQAETFAQFMQIVKSKRYTWTRIQRMLTHIFMGYTKQQQQEVSMPSYIRILGMTSDGQKYLSENKKKLKLPLISRVGKTTDPLLALDIRATDLYMLATGGGEPGLDFKTPPIRL
ncbi:MAG: nucleotidyltransferase [Kurthia sp.]|nr:nucleotidyltransferase [Candidatus Kurthia equi]